MSRRVNDEGEEKKGCVESEGTLRMHDDLLKYSLNFKFFHELIKYRIEDRNVIAII